jgi:Rod binding domain-containing protein
MISASSEALFNYKYANTPKIDQKLSQDDLLLKEQTDQFEAIFLQKILDISLKNDNPLFPKSAGNDIYQSMYNQSLSENMSGSFGFSELLFNYLQENR